MMKWILLGVGVAVLAVLLLTLIPVRYYFTFRRWRFFLHVDALLGLWKKELVLPRPKGPRQDEPAAEAADTDAMASALAEAEERAEADEQPAASSQEPEAVAPAESRTPEPTEARSQQPEAVTGQVSPPMRPSLFAQIRFAIGNGLAGKVFAAAWKLLVHSAPGKWTVCGRFGTGDPMDTGLVNGLCCAFFPGVTESVEWDYVEQVDTLEGEGRGRIIPLYALYLALTLLLSKEAREFWRYRKNSEKREA